MLRENENKSNLTLSSRRVGKLYPVLLDKHGNVIDGQHRLAVDKSWPKVTLDHVRSRKDLTMARLVSNVCRRRVTDDEKTKLLEELGKIHLQEGVSRGKIAQKIAEETGMSYRWVMQYLPNCLKERPGMGGPSHSLLLYKDTDKLYKCKVAFSATANPNILSLKPEKKILMIKDYLNTDFVHIMLDRRFFERIVSTAQRLELESETIVNNVFLLALKALEDLAESSIANPVLVTEK